MVIYSGVRSGGGGIGFVSDFRPHPYPAPYPNPDPNQVSTYPGPYPKPDPGPDSTCILGARLGVFGGSPLCPV